MSAYPHTFKLPRQKGILSFLQQRLTLFWPTPDIVHGVVETAIMQRLAGKYTKGYGRLQGCMLLVVAGAGAC